MQYQESVYQGKMVRMVTTRTAKQMANLEGDALRDCQPIVGELIAIQENGTGGQEAFVNGFWWTLTTIDNFAVRTMWIDKR